MLALIAGLFLIGQVTTILGQFSSIIIVFFLGWLLAFILGPVAEFFKRRGLASWAAIALVYLGLLVGIFIAIIVLVPILIDQVAQIGQGIPGYAVQINNWVASLQSDFNDRGLQIDLYTLYSAQNLVSQVSGFGKLLVENGIGLAASFASFALNTVIVLVISFYFMVDGGRILGVFVDMAPDEWQGEVSFLIENIDRKFGGFLRGQLIQAIIYGVGTAIIMSVFGLDYVLVAAVVAGLMMFIPFFGSFLGFIPPALVAILTLPFFSFIIFAIVLLILQQIVLNVIAPKVMSEAVGMHPILVFLALLLGVQIAGPLGAIFGVPVMAVINAMVVLFYNRSEAIQRHRARRLGIVVQPGLSEIQTRAREPKKPENSHVFWLEPLWWAGKSVVGAFRRRSKK
jgi:predicted PurR-regulated permease PerM